jgi:hypothetical protein
MRVDISRGYYLLYESLCGCKYDANMELLRSWDRRSDWQARQTWCMSAGLMARTRCKHESRLYISCLSKENDSNNLEENCE